MNSMNSKIEILMVAVTTLFIAWTTLFCLFVGFKRKDLFLKWQGFLIIKILHLLIGSLRNLINKLHTLLTIKLDEIAPLKIK